MNRPSRRTLLLLAAAVLIGVGACVLIRLSCGPRDRSGLEPYRQLIWKYAQANALPTELVGSVILAESDADPRAVSPKNAKGLMQITPVAERDVLARLDVPRGDLFDPDYNIRVGTKYLRMMLDRFGGDARMALAAYNAGPGKMEQLRKEHPDLSTAQIIDQYAPRETADYCERILGDKSPRF